MPDSLESEGTSRLVSEQLPQLGSAQIAEVLGVSLGALELASGRFHELTSLALRSQAAVVAMLAALMDPGDGTQVPGVTLERVALYGARIAIKDLGRLEGIGLRQIRSLTLRLAAAEAAAWQSWMGSPSAGDVVAVVPRASDLDGVTSAKSTSETATSETSTSEEPPSDDAGQSEPTPPADDGTDQSGGEQPPEDKGGEQPPEEETGEEQPPPEEEAGEGQPPGDEGQGLSPERAPGELDITIVFAERLEHLRGQLAQVEPPPAVQKLEQALVHGAQIINGFLNHGYMNLLLDCVKELRAALPDQAASSILLIDSLLDAILANAAQTQRVFGAVNQMTGGPPAPELNLSVDEAMESISGLLAKHEQQLQTGVAQLLIQQLNDPNRGIDDAMLSLVGLLSGQAQALIQDVASQMAMTASKLLASLFSTLAWLDRVLIPAFESFVALLRDSGRQDATVREALGADFRALKPLGQTEPGPRSRVFIVLEGVPPEDQGRKIRVRVHQMLESRVNTPTATRPYVSKLIIEGVDLSGTVYPDQPQQTEFKASHDFDVPPQGILSGTYEHTTSYGTLTISAEYTSSRKVGLYTPLGVKDIQQLHVHGDPEEAWRWAEQRRYADVSSEIAKLENQIDRVLSGLELLVRTLELVSEIADLFEPLDVVENLISVPTDAMGLCMALLNDIKENIEGNWMDGNNEAERQNRILAERFPEEGPPGSAEIID